MTGPCGTPVNLINFSISCPRVGPNWKGIAQRLIERGECYEIDSSPIRPFHVCKALHERPNSPTNLARLLYASPKFSLMTTALLLSSTAASRLLVDGQSYHVDKGLEVN